MGCTSLAGESAGYLSLSTAAFFVWPFLLAKVQFPIIGVDFLRHFKLLVDPAANRLVYTVSTQLLPTVSSVRSQPEPAEISATAAATPVGHSAASQVHVTDPAPASQPGCSQSGQPARAVTAVAAGQPPARPRFIALPPGSLGSVILDDFPEVANASKVQLQCSSSSWSGRGSCNALPLHGPALSTW
jgi:hypothetical protein